MKSRLTTEQYGTKIWKHPNSGVWHREDGPALEYASGTKHWYLNGIGYTEQEHKYKMRSKKLKQLLK